VRRASEGSRIHPQIQGALQECQQLQKGLAGQNPNALFTSSPPLADNSVSLPGSPIRCNKSILGNVSADDGQLNQDIDIPPDMMLSIMPGLEKLVLDNRLAMEEAQKIIQTQKVPLDVGQYLGLFAHTTSGYLLDSPHQHQQKQQQQDYQQQMLHHSQSVSPINYLGKYASSGTATATTNTSFLPNLSHFGGMTGNNLVNCFAVASAAASAASSVSGKGFF
jgi:hypothetical protein